MSITFISATDVKQCITMGDAIDAMEHAFLQLANKQVIMPLRTTVAIKNERATTHIMPAFSEQEHQLGMKVVSLFPNNATRNLPAINGVILLLDATTGEPKAIMDASYLTALRTGAVSGLATRLLAREDASHVAIIGSGVQALTQLEAVAHVRPIQRVSIWSRSHEHALVFASQIAHRFDTQVCRDIHQATCDADIICTATSSTEPLIHLENIKKDAHINAIGSHSRTMHEIAPEIFKHATTVVDQHEAAFAEAGEIIAAIEAGLLDAASVLELGSLLKTKESKLKQQLTVFKSVGLAIQDISIAEKVYANTQICQLGQRFDLS